MSMRDLIPWGRQDNSSAPAHYNPEESSPFLSLRRDVDRLFDDFFRGTVPGTSFLRSSMGWPSSRSAIPIEKFGLPLKCPA